MSNEQRSRATYILFFNTFLNSDQTMKTRLDCLVLVPKYFIIIYQNGPDFLIEFKGFASVVIMARIKIQFSREQY